MNPSQLAQQFELRRDAGRFVDRVIAIGKGEAPFYTKASVPVIGTGAEAAALLSQQAQAFVDLVEQPTTLGQWRLLYLPVPVLTGVADTQTEISAEWVAHGAPAPVAQLSISAATTEPTAFRVVIALTKELLRAADPRARTMVERRIVRGLRLAEDRLLWSDAAAVANVNPPGLLQGLSPIALGSPDTLDQDLFVELWTAVSRGNPTMPRFAGSPRAGAWLHTLRAEGARLFPDVGPLGGTIGGVPFTPVPALGEKLALVDVARLAVSDDGLDVDRTENAPVLMDDDPSSGPVQLVSSFQTDAQFVRFTRHLHWALTAADAVAFVTLPFAGSPQ